MEFSQDDLKEMEDIIRSRFREANLFVDFPESFFDSVIAVGMNRCRSEGAVTNVPDRQGRAATDEGVADALFVDVCSSPSTPREKRLSGRMFFPLLELELAKDPLGVVDVRTGEFIEKWKKGETE